ncbi:MAG TPA: hypothetical protein VNL73_09890 [Verrucomicrobiae bacterium]|nr:hypothetical protein [Verrucomicrobiae bacterium]
MNARVKKSWCFIALLIALSFLVFPPLLFALPKDKKQTSKSPPSGPVKNAPARSTPLVLDDDEMRTSQSGIPVPAPEPRYLGPTKIETAASPYIDVRIGIPETPGGNNHMRRQVALSPNGVVHMVYGVISGYAAADSARTFLYFYNAYDCGGSDSLQFGSLDKQMIAPGPPTDPRPRVMNQGGIFIPPGSNTPVVYGNRYILRTETPVAADLSRRGAATMKDSAECLGMFSMDTTLVPNNVPPIAVHWVMYPLNESAWVATCRPSSNPSDVGWSYTTDRGKSWTPVGILPTYSPWFNSVDITGAGNTVYVVSHADPNDPSAFTTTERPCYLKGTYNPTTGSLTWGTIQDITGPFEQPDYLSNMLGISALMIGDTLHVIWTDWNNWHDYGFAGPGGHVHHAAVEPNGTVQGPHKIADINIDGRLPGRSNTLFGFAMGVWPNVSLTYNPTTGVLYGLWSQPPDNGNFGWADYEQYGVLACYDIFCSASPNNGRAWDDAQNATQTNNPGCDGSVGDPCHHEDWFSTAEIADSVVNVVAMTQRYPGIQESNIRSGISPDVGPITETRDIFRLYRVPARAPIPSLRVDLDLLPGDTTSLDSIQLKPRAGIYNFPMQLANIGLADFILDSIKFTGTLNDGYLVTSTDALPGTSISVSQIYYFNLTLNTSGVGSTNQGLRSGFLEAYVHTDNLGVPSELRQKTVKVSINAFIVINLCLNHKMQIHSSSNYSDIGVQGSIKDQALGTYGMHYVVNEHDNFYDGGVLIAWNNNLPDGRGNCADGFPRKVTRQLFGDKFLRCVADGILDSVQGTGSYYNLFLKSVGTDIQDSTIAYQNIWEQSTHADSSDFLVQTTRVINIGPDPIDSVAMGVIYDVDVDVTGVVSASENVGGDTTVSHLGRQWWLGWVSGNDVAIDTCSPGQFAYGFVVVPGSIGNPGDTVRPRGAVVYQQSGFSYNIGCENPIGGDSLLERYAWNLDELASTRDRNQDSLTGTWQDTTAACIANGTCPICGNYSTGPPWRADIGYMAIAKKVYNLPVNGGGSGVVARFGLDGLAASVDTFFSGAGETYTIIHVASSGNGLPDLMANAVKGIDWYVNHSNTHVGPIQTYRKGDLNNDGIITPADVVEELQYVFLGNDVSFGNVIPTCVADMNNDGGLTPIDVVFVLHGAFSEGAACPNCLKPCI